MIGDAFAPGAALPDPRLEKNVRGASSPLLAALERAKAAVGVAQTASGQCHVVHEHAEPDPAGGRSLAALVAADGFLGRAEAVHAAALAACYEAGVLALPVAAVEDAEAALAFALDEVSKRAMAAPPRLFPGTRPGVSP